MLSRAEYNLRKSALKRQYRDALASVDVSTLKADNPYLDEMMQRKEARSLISGRGSYGRNVGGSIGAMAGGYFGNRGIGRAIGRSIGGSVSRLVSGRGAYSFRGQDHRTNKLFAENSPDISIEVEEDVDGIILTRSEFITQVTPTSSGLVNILTGDVNPLNATLFPWLSQISQYYREYELIQCFFEFESTVTGGDTSASGDVIMSSLTPFDDLFTDASSLKNYYSSVSSRTDTHVLCGVECGKRTGTNLLPVKLTPLNGNPSDYNVGQVQIATSGAAAGHTIGNIYVHYMIRLIKPVSNVAIQTAGTALENTGYVDCFSDPVLSGVAGQSQTNPLSGKNTALSLNMFPAGSACGVNGAAGPWCYIAKLAQSNSLSYRLQDGVVPVPLAANASCVWLGNYLANKVLEFTLRIPILSQVLGPYSDTYPTVAPFGNVQLVAPKAQPSFYYCGISRLSKIGNSILSEGFFVTYTWVMKIGDLRSDIVDDTSTVNSPGGFCLSVVGEGVSVTYGVTMSFKEINTKLNMDVEPHI